MAQYDGVAEALRALVAQFPNLPVKPAQVGLDFLEPKGESMCVQINPGQQVRSYVDGTEIWRQPFTVTYRGAGSKKNPEKSKMIAVLNSLGKWLGTVDPGAVAPGEVRGMRIGQDGLANISEQDSNVLAYSATFRFDYETL
jgi:hypothetical protein